MNRPNFTQRALVRLVASVLLCMAAAASQAWPTFSVTDPTILTFPPDPNLKAYGLSINNQGHVLVSMGYDAPGEGFYLCAGQPCALLNYGASWVGNSINKFDEVSGSFFAGTNIAFFGSMVIGYDRAVGGPGSGFGLNSETKASNQYGQATGAAQFPGTPGQQAFKYSAGSGMVGLPTLGGTNSEGRDINKWGDVAGHSEVTSGANTHAFLHHANMVTDLGTLAGLDSWAYGLNNQRTVVGCGTNPTSPQAFMVLSNQPMQPLPNLSTGPSCAWAVNNNNVAVGYATSGAGRHAAMWKNGQVRDLNLLLNSSGAGWTLVEAAGINAAGQIVSNGIHNGLRRPFLLY